MLSAIPKEEFGYILNSIKVYLYFYHFSQEDSFLKEREGAQPSE